MKCAISIVIPVYNVEQYIADCLQSVMCQTYQGPLECILVDDCGTDKSIEVAEKLIAEYDGPIDFKVLHHDHNRGVSAARNTGLDAAKGDYVYFLDSDDWISDDCIEKLAKPLQNEVFDVVVGDYKSVGDKPCHLKLSLPEGPYHEMGISKTFCDHGVYVMAWNKLYSKEFLNKNKLRFEEGRVHEDEILAFELSCVDKSFYVVNQTTYFYRIRENSIMTTAQANQMKRANGYIGILQSVGEKVQQFSKVEGIYDYYLHWVSRMFNSIARNLDESTLHNYIDKQIGGYLDVIPNVRCLQNKHNRFVYIACREEQSYSRYQYVTKVLTSKLRGRLLRKLLGYLLYKAN